MVVMKWLWNVAFKKAIKRGVQAVVSLLASQKVIEAGVTVDPIVLTTTIFSILEFVKNWLKHKVGVSWL